MESKNIKGLFGVAEDHTEQNLSLDEHFIQNAESTFYFLMEGQAMQPYIYHGDYLIVDRSRTQFLGQVLVVDYQGERICRYYTKDSGLPVLHAFDPAHRDIRVTDEESFVVFGVVTLSFRDLLRKGMVWEKR